MLFPKDGFRLGQTKTLIAAHRGARSLAPENTLLAAETAHSQGADLWELDLRSTVDNELVVLHDADLTRTTNATSVFPGRAPWRTETFSLADLKSLDCGSWFLEADPFGRIGAGEVSQGILRACPGQRIPTLALALELTRELDWALNLELKGPSWVGSGSRELIRKVVDPVRRMELRDRVLVSSFHHPALALVRALEPRLATGLLIREPAAEPGELLARQGAQTLHLSARSHPPRAVARLQRQGLPVMVWTVNDPALMEAYAQAGAWAICTDFPQRAAGP